MENHEAHSQHHPAHEQSPATSAWKGAILMVGVIIGFYLLREHWGHALGIAPYLLLLACPLMHVFMHHGPGHHHDHDNSGQRK